MESSDRRPQLPALSYLDVGKSHGSDDTSFQPHSADAKYHRSARSASPKQHESATRDSGTHGHVHELNGWSGSRPREVSDPHRFNNDEIESIKQTFRQSLPSLTEALNQPQLPPTSRAEPIEPASPRPRPAYSLEPQRPYASSGGYDYRQRDPLPGSYASSQDLPRPVYHSHPDLRPPVPPPPPPVAQPHESRPYQPVQAPGSEPHPPTPHAPSVSQSNVPYGYTSSTGRHPLPPAPSNGPVYQPSSRYGAPANPPPPTWKPENGNRYAHDDREPPAYRDSVKRHLEMYDLSTAFNEISSTSQIMIDFSRRYGEHLHQSARADPPPSMLPGLVEIEDMVNKSRSQLDSLYKIHEVVVAQQTAFEQQLASQRARAKIYTDRPSAQTPQQQPPPEISPDSDGFVNDNIKKRRMRAAPPGRCHSCNRAETPEWRRGPDGARTLCNACGLHYAKLTRKQASANKAATHASSSNLRPKE